MVAISSGSSPLGSSIETGELVDGAVTTVKIADGGVTAVKLGTDMAKRVLLETLNPSGDADVTSGTLDAYPNYFIECSLKGSANNDLGVQVNGQTSGYNYIYINNVTVTAATSQGTIMVGTVGQNYLNPLWFYLSGVTGTSAGQIQCMSSGLRAQKIGILGVFGTSSAVQTDTLKFLASTGTITGTIKIYGVPA